MALAEPQKRLMILTNTAGNTGGMERTAINLTRAFTRRGYQTRCLFPRTEKVNRLLEWSLEQDVPAEAAETFPLQTEKHSLADTYRMSRELAAWRPAAVSLHYPFYLSLKDVLAVRLAGVRRCVASVHSVPDWPEWQTSRQRKMTVQASRLVDRVIVHSHSVEKALIAAGIPARKIIHFPYGLRLPEYVPTKAEARARLGLPAEAFIVGTHARLDPEKGIANLIEAVSQMPADEHGPLLLIAGDGSQREELAALAAERLGPRAQMVGRIEGDKLANFYAALDVFSQTPIWQEAFGLVYIEAAFFRVPSVGWRSGGVAEAIVDGETGLLAAQHDLAGLAQTIDRLRQDPALREQLGGCAQARARSEFTETRMAENYALALDLAEGAPARQAAR